MAEGWVAVADLHTGRPDWIDAAHEVMLKNTEARALQGMALKVGAEDLGVLYTIHDSPLNFSGDLGFRAAEFAANVAGALKKNILLERVTHTKAAAEVVAEVTAAGNPDLVRSLQMIAEQAKEALGCGSVVFFEHTDERGLVHPATTAGVDRAVIEHPDEIKDYDLVLEAMTREEPWIVPRVMENDRFKDRRFVQKEFVRSSAAIPLKVGSRKVGVMFVNYRSDH